MASPANARNASARQEKIDPDRDTFEHISVPVARVMHRLAEAIREAAK